MTTVTTRPASASAAATAPLLRVAVSRIAVELRLFFREKATVVFAFLLPIALLGIFSVAFGGESIFLDSTSGIDFVQYFMPGMVAAGIMMISFQTLAISIATERDDRTLKRLRGTPMPPIAYFLGKIGMVLVAASAQVALLFLVAVTAFGVELPSDPASWLTFGWVFVLGTAAGTTLGIAYSSLPKSAKSAEAMVVGPLLLLLFISGVFFLYNDLPGWLQTAAAVFPVKWLAQGMRSALLPEEFAAVEVSGAWEHGPIALILTAWTVAALIMATRTFRWQRRDDG